MTECIFFGCLIMLFIILIPHMRHPLKEDTYWMDRSNNIVKLVRTKEDEKGVTWVYYRLVNECVTGLVSKDTFLKLYKKLNQ